MKYLYYPGCSLQGSAREYDISTRAVLAALDVELVDIADWTCCGASAAEASSGLLALALPARVLALAEAMNTGTDILVPCSACYLNLKKVVEKVRKEPETLARINTVLAEEKLVLKGEIAVRHLLDVLAKDLGGDRLAAKIRRYLRGITVAPYYGCQCLRPYAVFDDPEKPVSMEPLIAATGAVVHPWTMGAVCCGASHMNTKMAVGIALVTGILRAAKGADVIVTVCPMCQMNLEAYQRQVSAAGGEDLSVSILYLPQLLGLAMGLDEGALGVGLNLALDQTLQDRIAACG